MVSSRGHMSGVASAGQWGVTSSGGVNGQHMSVVTSVTRDTRGGRGLVSLLRSNTGQSAAPIGQEILQICGN